MRVKGDGQLPALQFRRSNVSTKDEAGVVSYGHQVRIDTVFKPSGTGGDGGGGDRAPPADGGLGGEGGRGGGGAAGRPGSLELHHPSGTLSYLTLTVATVAMLQVL